LYGPDFLHLLEELGSCSSSSADVVVHFLNLLASVSFQKNEGATTEN